MEFFKMTTLFKSQVLIAEHKYYTVFTIFTVVSVFVRLLLILLFICLFADCSVVHRFVYLFVCFSSLHSKKRGDLPRILNSEERLISV